MPQLGIEISVDQPGANLLAVLSRAQVPVARSCGGDGVCGTCRVRIEGEDVPVASAHEIKLIRKQGAKADERMACLVVLPASSKTWVVRTDYW